MSTSLLPLIVSLFTITILLISSLAYRVYEHPFLIQEGGVIETLTAVGYFVCALLAMLAGKWSYIKRHHCFFILIIFFGLRELDFHKRFTTMGMFKLQFYLSNSVPVIEKLAGLLVLAILLYIVISIVTHHSHSFFRNIKHKSPVHIGVLLTFLVLVFTKTIDGIGRKLGDLHVVIDPHTSILLEVVEEVLELGIPLLIISTFIIYFSVEHYDKSLSRKNEA
jgi:hypothetical protein